MQTVLSITASLTPKDTPNAAGRFVGRIHLRRENQVEKLVFSRRPQALVCGATVENAARKAGVSERTAYRRLHDPEFRQRLAGLRLEMIQRTAGMLTGAGPVSVKTLVDLLQDVAVAAAVRRRAARDVLEMGLKLRDHAEVEARLAAVEARLARALAPEDGPMDKAVAR